MNKLYLIALIFMSSCSQDNCVDKVCPYNHNGCINCTKDK